MGSETPFVYAQFGIVDSVPSPELCTNGNMNDPNTPNNMTTNLNTYSQGSYITYSQGSYSSGYTQGSYSNYTQGLYNSGSYSQGSYWNGDPSVTLSVTRLREREGDTGRYKNAGWSQYSGRDIGPYVVGWTGSNITIDPNEDVALRWSSRYARNCRGSGFSTQISKDYPDNYANSGINPSVREPGPGTSRTYRVTCESPFRGTATDSITVTTRFPLSLEVSNLSNDDGFVPRNITIDEDDEVALRWSSFDGAVCRSDQFVTNNEHEGTQYDVVEPAVDTFTAYRVNCTSDGVTKGVTRRVTRTGVVTQAEEEVGEEVDPWIVAEPEIVRYGESSEISWEGAAADSCTVAGYGLNSTDMTGTELISNFTGESIYTLTCLTDGVPEEVTAKVRVLPNFQET